VAVLAHVQEAVQLRVALVDRGAVGGVQLGARDLLLAEQASRFLGGETKGVDHEAPPGGTAKKSPSRAGAFASASSAERHGRGPRALGALHNLERHALAFGQRLVAFHSNGREVDEDVIAALALDEAIALLVGEPLNGALCQLRFLLTTNDGTARSRRPIRTGGV